jgi:ABC-type branched-subunit amino acid transport system ATPase component
VSLLVASGLSKQFGGVLALRTVDVTQEQGETLGMIGPNGSGKTTFVNAMTGLLQLDSGTIDFEGRPIAGLRTHEIAHRGLVRTYQAVRVFAKLTVRENLHTARIMHRGSPVSDTELSELLQWLTLTHRLDVSAGALTLFEQRRLELAVRLVLRPRLLMLDEPVGGLAANEVRDMIELLKQLRMRCSIFVIEHTMKVIRELADRVIVLIAGEKIADGPPVQILKDQRVIEQYLGAVHA